MLNSSIFSIKTKINPLNNLVISVLIYGSENWKTTKQEKKKQYTFQNRSLGQILRMRWTETIANQELHRRCDTTNASESIMQKRWRWICHVLRMDNRVICITALTWQPEGKRKVRLPKTTWRRTVEIYRKRQTMYIQQGKCNNSRQRQTEIVHQGIMHHRAWRE